MGPALGPIGEARAAEPVALTVSVDASDAPRRIFHAHLTLAVRPGPLTLAYPRWTQGEHAPSGPIGSVAGLRFAAGGKPVTWKRDPENPYHFLLEVPPGASRLDADLDYLAPVSGGSFSGAVSTTAQLFVLAWNQVVLYPAGTPHAGLTVAASLKTPPGWKIGTALETAGRDKSGIVTFKPVSLEHLVDSPVLSGALMRDEPLGVVAGAEHVLHLASDGAAALDVPKARLDAFRRLVAEAHALFGVHHYDRYHFLLTLSDLTSHFGLEHHESSDNRRPERALVDDDAAMLSAGLLPHEFVHSWNGKHRRPAGIATPDFDAPMRTELLWIYEGLTTYLGTVLTARAGLLNPEQARESLALTAAGVEHTSGRAWRPLEDTATAAYTLYGSSDAWHNWRRGVDFYPEGELIWLEADLLLRGRSGGGKSLDDFCRSFHGGTASGPTVRPYALADVVAALDALAPLDWAAHLRARLDAVGKPGPLAALPASGWTLIYDERPNAILKASDDAGHTSTLTFSIGAVVRDDGLVADVVPGMAAAAAGLGPGMRVIAVGGRRFSKRGLGDAVAASKATRGLDLVVENGDYVRTVRIAYAGGVRQPHLRRDESRPDVLSKILAAQVR